MWCDVPWGLHSPGPTPSSYPRRVSAVVLPSGSSEKVLSAPARAHALPDVHTDRARSGAAQAAQGPRTGSVGRRDPRYWYEAPEAEWKYPTHAAISACATRRDPRWPISRPTQTSTHSQHILGIQSVFSELPRFTCGPSVLLTGSPAFDGHSPNHPPTTPLNRSLDKKNRSLPRVPPSH